MGPILPGKGRPDFHPTKRLRLAGVLALGGYVGALLILGAYVGTLWLG